MNDEKWELNQEEAMDTPALPAPADEGYRERGLAHIQELRAPTQGEPMKVWLVFLEGDPGCPPYIEAICATEDRAKQVLEKCSAERAEMFRRAWRLEPGEVSAEEGRVGLWIEECEVLS